MDWGDVIAGLCIELRAAGRSEGTVRLRRNHLQQFASATGPGGRRLHPDPLAVQRCDLVAWLARPMAPEYRRSVRSSLVALFGWLAVEQLPPGPDPAARLAPVRIPAGVPKPADDRDILTALAAARPRTLLMLRLAAELGLRRGEVARVDTRHLELAGLRVTGKGGRTRVVPLPGDLRAVLSRLPAGPVFPSSAGGHLTPGHVGVLMSRALPAGITPHQLRHAAATAWHDAGLDIADISPLLGHARLDTTARYVLVRNTKARAAVETASARLRHPAGRRPAPPIERVS